MKRQYILLKITLRYFLWRVKAYLRGIKLSSKNLHRLYRACYELYIPTISMLEALKRFYNIPIEMLVEPNPFLDKLPDNSWTGAYITRPLTK